MQLLPTANDIIFRALIPGYSTSGAQLDTAYVEFSNGLPIVPADVDPALLHQYFDALNATSSQDYLRIPITTHNIKTRPDGQTELVMTIATDGSTGEHGKQFSPSVASRVYAVTLAASQDNDRGDIFFSRHHYAVADQLSVPNSGCIMLPIAFSVTQ